MGWIARKRKRSQRFYTIPDRDEGVSFSEKVAMGIMVFVAFGAVVALYVGKVPLGVLLLLMVVLSGLSLPLAYNVGGLFLSISHDDRRQQLRIELSAMGVYLHGVIAFLLSLFTSGWIWCAIHLEDGLYRRVVALALLSCHRQVAGLMRFVSGKGESIEITKRKMVIRDSRRICHSLYWKDRPVVAGVRGVDEVLIRYRGDREKIASLIVLPLSKPQLKKMVGYYCDDPQARARLGQPDSVRDVSRVLGWTV